MDHAVLEDTLPFVLDTRHLDPIMFRTKARSAHKSHTLSYVQKTMSLSAPLTGSSRSPSESESSRSLLMASSSSSWSARDCIGCGRLGCAAPRGAYEAGGGGDGDPEDEDEEGPSTCGMRLGPAVDGPSAWGIRPFVAPFLTGWDWYLAVGAGGAGKDITCPPGLGGWGGICGPGSDCTLYDGGGGGGGPLNTKRGSTGSVLICGPGGGGGAGCGYG